MSAVDKKSEVYKQIHDLAVRYGSKLIIESALEAARNSQQVRLTDEAISRRRLELNDEPETEQSLTLFLPPSETDHEPHDAISLATALMSGAIANQQPSKRVHVEFVRPYSPILHDLFFCSNCLIVLQKYYQVLTKHQPSCALSTTTHLGSMLGTLTLESISRNVLDSILREEGIMSLFESLHLRLDDCLVPSHTVDRLRSLISDCESLQQLRLSKCSILGRDIEALVRTKGLGILHLDQVEVDDYPGFVANPKRVMDIASLPKIKMQINHDRLNEYIGALWQTVYLMPKVDELSVNVGPIAYLATARRKMVDATTPIQGFRVTSRRTLENPSEYADMISYIMQHRHEKPFTYVHVESHFVQDGQNGYDEEDALLAGRIILDCALSTTHHLHSLSFRFGSPKPIIRAMNGHLESLENPNIDISTGPGVSHLRRFGVFPDVRRWDTLPDYLHPNYLQSMLTFLTTHLPYVYYIGEGVRFLANDQLWENQDQTRNLRQQILLQLERNQVGVALLHPDVYPSVPSGLWPLILENAVSPRPTSSKVKIPYSGVFALIKELAARDVINSSHKIQEVPGIKRRKLNPV